MKAAVGRERRWVRSAVSALALVVATLLGAGGANARAPIGAAREAVWDSAPIVAQIPPGPGLQRPLTILVVIPETHLGRATVPDPAAETEIIRQLIAAGYTVVDQSRIGEIRYAGEVRRMARAPTPELARELGSRFRADVLIVGEAFSEAAGTVGSMVSVRARVEVRVVLSTTGQIIASEAAAASAADIAENIAGKTALATAARMVAGQILPRLATLRGAAVGEQSVPGSAATPQAQTVDEPRAPAEAPPTPTGREERLRVAVLRFQVATVDPRWTQLWDIGTGVTEMVEEALFNRGRYRLVERRQLEQVLREQGLGLTGAVDAATAARVGRVAGVQALIMGTVNQFDLSSAGGVVLPLPLPVPIGIGVGVYRAQVALTARVVDANTAEILGIVRGNGRADGTVAMASLQVAAFGGGEFRNSVLGRALTQAIQDLVNNLDAGLSKRP